MIREAGTSFDVAEYRAGRQTPVFFGSALTNFGVEPFLQALVELAPPPQGRMSDSGVVNASIRFAMLSTDELRSDRCDREAVI